MSVCTGEHMSSLISSDSICGQTYLSLLALRYVPIWHLQSSINPHFLFPLCCGLCVGVTEHKRPFNVLTNRNMVHSVLHADPEELLKDSEKCHLHRLSSGVKFIQTCWSRHWITFSRHTMRTKERETREAQIKTSQGPRVCTSSVCWWGARRPLLLLYWHCVPFQSPPTISVSFITALDGSARASGVPGLQELGLSPPKGQWCCPKASYPSILQYTGKDGKTVQLWTSVPQKKRGCGWVRKR